MASELETLRQEIQEADKQRAALDRIETARFAALERRLTQPEEDRPVDSETREAAADVKAALRAQGLHVWDSTDRHGEPITWIECDTWWSDAKNGLVVIADEAALTEALPQIQKLPGQVGIQYFSPESTLELVFEMLGSVPQLVALELQYCHISDRGWELIGGLHSVEDMLIRNCWMKPEDLEKVVQNQNLRRLELDNLLDMPADGLNAIGQLPRLEEILIWWTGGNDSLLAALSNCTRLEVVSLHNAKFTEDAVVSFLRSADRSPLRVLHPGGTVVTVTFIRALRATPNLEELSLRHREFGRHTARELVERVPKLRSLSVYPEESNETLEPEVLRQLARLTHLERLVARLKVEPGEELSPILRLSRLQVLDLQTPLNRESLEQFACLPELRELTITELDLDEQTAELLPWLTNLEKLWIDNEKSITNDELMRLAVLPRLKEVGFWGPEEPVPSGSVREAMPHVHFFLTE